MNNDADILLVEDHPDTQALLLQLFTQAGHAVLTADNGQQALDLLSERGIRPQLIVLDLMLPAVSGRDLLDFIRSDPDLRRIPIVVITGVPQDRINVVADAVFRKPLDFDQLLAKVRTLIARNA